MCALARLEILYFSGLTCAESSYNCSRMHIFSRLRRSLKCSVVFPNDISVVFHANRAYGGQHADASVLELRFTHPVDGESIGDAQRVEALLLTDPALQHLAPGAPGALFTWKKALGSGYVHCVSHGFVNKLEEMGTKMLPNGRFQCFASKAW